MKKQLLIKLYACLPAGMAFIVTAMMFSASSNAQIVYTDILPDSTLYCQVPHSIVIKSYNLDLNNDANHDFILTAKEGGFGASSVGSTSITPQVNNAFITTST